MVIEVPLRQAHDGVPLRMSVRSESISAVIEWVDDDGIERATFVIDGVSIDTDLPYDKAVNCIRWVSLCSVHSSHWCN